MADEVILPRTVDLIADLIEQIAALRACVQRLADGCVPEIEDAQWIKERWSRTGTVCEGIEVVAPMTEAEQAVMREVADR